MRRLFAVLAATVMLIGSASCSEKDAVESGGTVTAKNDYPVTAFGERLTKCPQSVISLSPAVTDVIVSLGSDAQLIGVSDSCDNPRGLETYGSSAFPITSRILESGADLVFASSAIGSEDEDEIEDSGITVVIVPSISKYDEIFDFYVSVATLMSGRVTGRRNAENTYSRIDSRIITVKNRLAGQSAKACVILSDGISAADGTLAAQMLDFAGGVNVCPTGEFDSAFLAQADPAYIFCPPEMVRQITSDEALQSTHAVTNGNVIAFSPLYFERIGVNLATGVEIMASTMYPQVVESPIRNYTSDNLRLYAETE